MADVARDVQTVISRLKFAFAHKTSKNNNTERTQIYRKPESTSERPTELFGFCDGFLFSVLFVIILLTMLIVEARQEKKKMKLTVFSDVYSSLTTEVLDRHFCPIGLFADAGNYQIFPRKLFTNSFQSLQTN